MSPEGPFLLVLLLLVLSCGNSHAPLSGTSEQGNARIMATIYTSKGTLASGASVRLRPATYIAQSAVQKPQADQDIIDGFVENDGKITLHSFSFNNEHYYLEINNNKDEALLKTIVVSSRSQVVDLGDNSLKPYAPLQGKILPSDSTSALSLKIEGIERYIPVASNGMFSVPDLPASMYTLHIDASDTLSARVKIDSVTTTAGITTTLPERTWHHSKALHINSSRYAAFLTEPLYHAALPVRLDTANFLFSQSGAKARDLWFSRRDRTPLPYHIEQWDSAGARATLWVTIDTITNRNEQNYFIMHWGDQNVAMPPTPGIVFDTANGFLGVWHLSETITEEAVDFTYNRFDGTRVYVTAVDGVSGNGQLFDGSTSYVVIKNTASSVLNLKENSDYTITAWVHPEQLSGEQVIIGKGPAQYALKITDSSWVYSEKVTVPSSGERIVQSRAQAGVWTFLAAVCRDGKLSLYVNGIMTDSTGTFTADTTPRDETFDVNIGRVSSPRSISTGFFRGSLDEITLSGSARSPEWIRALYECQRPGSDVLINPPR